MVFFDLVLFGFSKYLRKIYDMQMTPQIIFEKYTKNIRKPIQNKYDFETSPNVFVVEPADHKTCSNGRYGEQWNGKATNFG